MEKIQKVKKIVIENEDCKHFIKSLADLTIKHKKKLFDLPKIIINSNGSIPVAKAALIIGTLIENDLIKERDSKYMLDLTTKDIKSILLFK